MNMQNGIKYVAFAIVVAVVVFSLTGVVKGNNFASVKSNAVAPVSSGNAQQVTLKMVNYEYVVSEPLQVGVPVEMTVDLDTVYGCMRDVVISSFNVRKTVSEGDNVIKFTPDKSGTFPIVCSMNMGRGSFVVEDSAGKVADVNEAESVLSAPAGGCGCAGGAGGAGAGSCGGY